MINHVHIQLGNNEDCEAVLALLQQAFAPLKGKIDPESGVWGETVEKLKERLPQQTLLLAKLDGTLVGCLFYVPKGDDLYFGRLATDPTHQKQGIAAQLIQHTIAAARAGGYKRVTLFVRNSLPANRRLFESLGFTITGEGTHEGYSTPTFYKMALTL